MFGFLKDKDRTPPTLPEGTVRRRYRVSGRVQGSGSGTGRGTPPASWA